MDLEQPALISGTVTRFKGNGRKLGYPTANLMVETELKDGVYFGYADMADWNHHPSLIFIGIPTTLKDTSRRVETYLLDIPDHDYYGLNISVSVEAFHRENQTFASIEELQKAMKDDEAVGREWFNRHQA